MADSTIEWIEADAEASKTAVQKGTYGIPILEVYSISYLGSSPLKAEDQIGSISLTTNNTYYDLYYQAKVDKSKPSIKYGDQLPMMDVGPICSFTNLELKCNLSDKHKGSEILSYLSPNEIVSSHSPNDGDWLVNLSIKSKDSYERNISALFGCFSNAMVANLKVMLSPSAGSSDATTNVYGVVLASNSKFDHPSCTSYLFSQNFASRIQVEHNDLIPLSKSRLGVPLDSQFYVDISLSCDGIPYEGTAEFIPNIKKVDSKVVAGKIKVEVTWNCGEYIYSTDEDSDFTDEDLDFTNEDSDELDSWSEYEYSMSDIEKEISETSLEAPYYEMQKSYD